MGGVTANPSYPVVLQIASEPLTDDKESTFLLAYTLIFYFFFWPIYYLVFLRCRCCGTVKKTKLSTTQKWGHKKCCCFNTCCGCCGNTEFDQLENFVDKEKLERLEGSKDPLCEGYKDPFRLEPGCEALRFYWKNMKAYYTRLDRCHAFKEIADTVVVILTITTHFIQVFMYDYCFFEFRILSFIFLFGPVLMFW